MQQQTNCHSCLSTPLKINFGRNFVINNAIYIEISRLHFFSLHFARNDSKVSSRPCGEIYINSCRFLDFISFHSISLEMTVLRSLSFGCSIINTICLRVVTMSSRPCGEISLQYSYYKYTACNSLFLNFFLIKSYKPACRQAGIKTCHRKFLRILHYQHFMQKAPLCTSVFSLFISLTDWLLKNVLLNKKMIRFTKSKCP